MSPILSPTSRIAGRQPGRPRSGPKGRLGAAVRLVLAGHLPGETPGGSRIPALAVLGRSNVGKSSLLNALLGVPAARVSATPGRTQALYWYRVDDAFDVVDCPGYGFARTGHEQRRKMEALLEGLLADPGDRGSPGLLAAPSGPVVDAALLLVDGRLAPQEADRSMALFLANTGIPTVVVATKWDAVRPAARPRQLRALSGEFARADRPLLPVSSETGENLNDLVRLLRKRLEALHRGRVPSGAAALPT
jgi:GTP-binding protein